MSDDDDRKRRSNIVGLTVLGLFGTIFIADKVIPQGTEMRRNVYTNRADCERDYSTDQCQQNSSGGGSSTGSGGYHGPYYRANTYNAPPGDPGPGRSGVFHASYETSYRGGFGAFGRAVHVAA
jgi:hypothetical protein